MSSARLYHQVLLRAHLSRHNLFLDFTKRIPDQQAGDFSRARSGQYVPQVPSLFPSLPTGFPMPQRHRMLGTLKWYEARYPKGTGALLLP